MDTTDINCDEQHFNEFATRIALSALCNPELKLLRGTFKTTKFDEQIKKLGLTDTQRGLLFDSIAFGKRLSQLYKPVTRQVLDRNAKRIDRLLEEIYVYFPPFSLTAVLADGTEEKLGSIGGDFNLSVEAEGDLRRMSAVSKHMSALMGRRKTPHIGYIGQLAYLWPAFYLESITGTPHYDDVAFLLSVAGWGNKQPEQLVTAAKSVRQRSPSVAQWMIIFLRCLPGEGARVPSV